jgi:hypothetical protein
VRDAVLSICLSGRVRLVASQLIPSAHERLEMPRGRWEPEAVLQEVMIRRRCCGGRGLLDARCAAAATAADAWVLDAKEMDQRAIELQQKAGGV